MLPQLVRTEASSGHSASSAEEAFSCKVVPDSMGIQDPNVINRKFFYRYRISCFDCKINDKQKPYRDIICHQKLL